MQDRLWITEPARSTCLATVTEIRGTLFAVDKPLFAPRSTALGHPQNHDKGTVWIEGEKRRLQRVIEDGKVWYGLRGTVPEVGATLQCQLDQDIRAEASRAHTAMHLWLHAMPTKVAEVKGGGHFRLTYPGYIAPKKLAETLQYVQSVVAADKLVHQTYSPDGVPQVVIGEHRLDCDGSHVDRTGRISRVVVSHAAMGKEGFVVGCRVS